MRYKLDKLILNSHEMTLHEVSSNQLISCDEKTINALTLLVAHYPDAVPKEAFIQTLWPNQVVSEWSLTRFISDLRKTIGPDHHIKTVHGRGYRYTFPIQELGDPAPETQHPEIAATPQANTPKPTTARHRQPITLAIAAISCLILAGLSVLIIAGSSPKTESPGTLRDLPFAPSRIKPVIAVVPLYHAQARDESALAYAALIADSLRHAQSLRIVDLAAALDIWRPRKAMAPNLTMFTQYCRPLSCTDVVFVGTTNQTPPYRFEYIHLNSERRYRSSQFTDAHPMTALEKLHRDLRQHLQLKPKNLQQRFHANSDATLLYGEALGAVTDNDQARARLLLKTLTGKHPDFISAHALLTAIQLKSRPSNTDISLTPPSFGPPVQQRQLDTAVYREQWLKGDSTTSLQMLEQLLARTPVNDFALEALNTQLDKGIILLGNQQPDQAKRIFNELKQTALHQQYYRLGTQAIYCEIDSLKALGQQLESEQATSQAHALADAIHYQGHRSCTMDLLSQFR